MAMDEDQAERIDALAGALLGHTSMLVATLAVLREAGVIDRGMINTILDTAMVGAETASPAVSDAERDGARRLLESLAEGMRGPPRADDPD